MVEEGTACPFCKMPPAMSSEENVARLQSHVDKGERVAIRILGEWYAAGLNGIEKSTERAMALWERAANLGDGDSAYHLACTYDERLQEGEASESENALRYTKMAADLGHTTAQAEMAYFFIAGFCDNGQIPLLGEAFSYLKTHDADSAHGEEGFLEAARYLRLAFEAEIANAKTLVDEYRRRGIDVLTDPPTRNLPRS